MLAGMISSPTAYSPRTQPGGGGRARATSCLRRCASSASSSVSDEEFEQLDLAVRAGGLDDRAADRGVARSLLHRLAAPAARRPLRRRRGVRRRPEDRVDPRPRPAAGGRRTSSARGSPASGPTSAVVVLDNDTAEVLAMVGGQDFDEGAVQPGDQRSAPAGFLVQAVHARDRAERTASPRPMSTSPRPQEIPFEAQITQQERRAQEGHRPLPRQQLRRQLPRQCLADDRDDVLRQLRLRPGRHRGRHRQDRRDGARHGDLVRARRQPGDDPRRPRARRHPARDGLRLHDPRQPAGSRSAARWPAGATAKGRSAILKVKDDEGEFVPDDTRRRAARTRPPRIGDRRGRRQTTRSTSFTPSSPAAPARTPRSARLHLGQDRHDRQQRRRLVRRLQRGRHRRSLGRLPGRRRRRC